MGNFPSSLYRTIHYTVGSLYRAPTVLIAIFNSIVSVKREYKSDFITEFIH